MNIKCHWCHKDLEPLDGVAHPYDPHDPNYLATLLDSSINDSELHVLECPDVHCTLTLELKEGYEEKIIGYTFYVDHTDGKRYKVCGHRKFNQTSFFIKVPNTRSRYDNPLNIKRYLAFKPNKETGILEGEAIFKRLKNLIIFS